MKKAVEIAYKNIRMRLSRSLLVTSGIVLALAFLMSIQANEAIVRGMRDWVANWRASPQYKSLDQQRLAIEEQIKPLDQTLREAASQAGNKATPLGQKVNDLKEARKKADAAAQAQAKSLEELKNRKAPDAEVDAAKKELVTRTAAAKAAKEVLERPREDIGNDITAIQKEIGAALPGAPDALLSAMAADPSLVAHFKKWTNLQSQRRDVGRQLSADKEVISRMDASGVPTAPAEVENARTQTYWMLSLALLVAFVGILNAMLMSVTERFREIGTMKCLGALDSFIVKLFLIESLFQGIIGTILGLLTGLVLTFVASSLSYGSYAFKNLPLNDILISAGLVFLVGVALTVGGAVYPAWQAARMAPVEAMRVET